MKLYLKYVVLIFRLVIWEAPLAIALFMGKGGESHG